MLIHPMSVRAENDPNSERVEFFQKLNVHTFIFPAIISQNYKCKKKNSNNLKRFIQFEIKKNGISEPDPGTLK